MEACVITIGNEILKGRTVNTNAAHIGKFLTTRGYEVTRGLTVKDDLDDIKWAIDNTNGFYDLIITTGGLGPTFDDMTVAGVARALNIELVEDTDTLRELKERYVRLGMELTTERLKLALIPRGATAIKNKVGAAPGIWISGSKSKILILPGVPREMEAILESAGSLLSNDSRYYFEETRHLEGVMESSMAPAVNRLMEKMSGRVYIKSHPLKSETNHPEIDIEVSAYAETAKEAEDIVRKTIGELLDEASRVRRNH